MSNNKLVYVRKTILKIDKSNQMIKIMVLCGIVPHDVYLGNKSFQYIISSFFLIKN